MQISPAFRMLAAPFSPVNGNSGLAQAVTAVGPVAAADVAKDTSFQFHSARGRGPVDATAARRRTDRLGRRERGPLPTAVELVGRVARGRERRRVPSPS